MKQNITLLIIEIHDLDIKIIEFHILLTNNSPGPVLFWNRKYDHE